MVDAQEVVEDLGVAAVVLLHLAQFGVLLVHDGLDAARDGDEGALRGVAHVLLAVDEVEHLGHQPALRLGQLGVRGVTLDDDLDGFRGRVAGAQPVQGLGQQIPGHPLGLVVTGGETAFQMLDVAGGLGPLPFDRAAAAYRLGGHQDQQERGEAAAQGDGEPRGLRHHRDGGSGRRGHGHGGQQQHACVGDLSATGRRLNTHHVCPLNGRIGEMCGYGDVPTCAWGDELEPSTRLGTNARICANSVRCGRA